MFRNDERFKAYDLYTESLRLGCRYCR